MSGSGIRVNVGAAIVREGKILLVEFHDENGPHFNLPGGGVDPGESLEEALKRECRLAEGCEPRLPGKPDPNQVGVKWVPLAELGKAKLFPTLANELLTSLETPSMPIQVISRA